MSEQLDTTVDVDNNQPVTDTAKSDQSPKTPKVETREGKLFVDGVRVYTRDDTNRIAANAKKEIETKLLQDLEVDNFDQVKSVVQQLRTGGEDNGTLNVQSLRDAVKKREQTVEELRAELARVKTDSMLKEHLNQLTAAMPAQWNADQRAAVVDLMKARNMLQLENETFAIRNGDNFFTDASGERPDYAAAAAHIGKTLGLPVTKQGVSLHNTPHNEINDGANIKALDQKRLQNDAAYRNAYVQVRQREKNLGHSDITDAMVRKHMDSTTRGSASERMLSNTGVAVNKPNSRR